jgi:hypothetical protein
MNKTCAISSSFSLLDLGRNVARGLVSPLAQRVLRTFRANGCYIW